MFLLRAQIVRLILGTGQFGWLETRLTAACLGLFCFAIFAFAVIPFLARVFYSFQDTKTPVAISLVTMVLNISLCFLFVWLLSFSNLFQEFIINALKLGGIEHIGVVGLPLALSISGIWQFCLLLFFLRKKLGHIRLMEIRSSFLKIILASILMGFSVYLVRPLLADLVNMQTFAGILTQIVLASLIGALVYILLVRVLKSPEISTIKLSIFQQFKR